MSKPVGKSSLGEENAFWKAAKAKVSVSEALDRVPKEGLKSRFSEETGAKVVRDIPLVPRQDAWLAWLDPEVFADFGVSMGRFGLTRPEDEARILRNIAVQAPEPGQLPTQHAAATLYTDEGVVTHLSQSPEKVRLGQWAVGDGRAGVIGRALQNVFQDPEGRARIQRAVQRVKGFPTNLQPRQDWDDVHTTGAQGAYWALEDLLLGEYLALNGVNIVRTPAEAFTHDSFQFSLFGMTLTQEKGFELGLGQFDRLAHLNLLKQNPQALREFLDQDGRLLADELGRDKPFTHAELFEALVDRKAGEVSAIYWAKAAHGSPTLDNVGLLQSVDPATIVVVDRAHPNFALLSAVSEGYGHEPEQFLLPYYSEFLFQCFETAAAETEREALNLLSPETIVRDALSKHMTIDFLEQLGVAPVQAQALWKTSRAQVEGLQTLARDLGQQIAQGIEYEMGTPASTVKDPARYSLFSTLSVLAEVHGSSRTREEKIAALVRAMDPLDPDASRDRAAAASLLDAVAPVLNGLAEGLKGDARTYLWTLMTEQAHRLNESTPKMIRSTLDAWSLGLYQNYEQGKSSTTRFRAEIRAYLRDQIRRGPLSMVGVADRLRQNLLPRTDDGAWVLSRIDERGVRIEELSDGEKDWVRFSLAPEAMKAGRLSSPRLRYTLDGITFQSRAPTRTNTSGVPVWDIPVQAKTDIQVVQGLFVDEDDSKALWDLDGLNFGTGHRPVLASALVDAALGVYATQHQKTRSQTPAAAIQAAQHRAV